MGFKNQLDESTGNQRIAFLPVSAGPKCILHKNALALCAASRADLPSQELILLMILWSSNVVPFSDIFDSSLLASEQSQIAHLYPTEWGRRLGWAGEAFIKGMSYKLPSHVHLSTDLTLVVPSGAGALWRCRAAGEFAVLCGPGAAWAWVSNSDVRRRENSFECDKLQIMFLQDSFC